MSSAAAIAAEPGAYFDEALQTRAFRVLPAEYRVTDQPIALVTLLGSCVAACLYDPALGVGGMNHFMLPDAQPASLPPRGGDGSARYGAHAMELLINDLLKRGARRSHLQAKVFGGGNVLRGFTSDPIGTRNARFVLDYLGAERIPVLAQDLGDVHPRKVCFFAQTGRALVRRLPITRDEEIVRAERALYGRLTRAPVSGSVELFS
ncbi:chemoreceptor glutamine deamidase CheD [Lysobacter sp. N42]|jgi:chemotaxis protein CheD|uniref:chemoreceptor glutamine deamidase CheD n=1 Tax=Lysobacter sp. N42 TaxID=2545719 RepID=UPI001044684C|nr:chemoreceptor glutamine deamidase CheD [Lysobacter sp. N42]TCZ87925.1 chemoreceptor glutamine deamidase CheD [Lysobacter sp. N42]